MNRKFARWHLLFFQYLKRDWKKILFWLMGLGLFSAIFVPAFEEIAKGDGLLGMYETLQNPAMIAMVGPTSANTSDAYTLGAMYSHMMLLYSALFSMIVSMMHVIAHTRKEEDNGLTEMIQSFQVGRQANSLAVFTETVLVNVKLTLFITVVMASFKADTISIYGAFIFGGSIGIAGVIGASITLLMAQIMPTASLTTGASLSIIGLLYIVRGATDIYSTQLSMLNPLAWTYLTYPFTKNSTLPFVLAMIFCLILVALSFFLEERRDMGSGYLPEREGSAYARPSLLSVPGLLFRLNKTMIISSLIAFFILGAAYGSIYGDMESFIESNALMTQMFAVTGVTIEASFTATLIIILVGLVSILPIAIINRLFEEEKTRRLSQIFSTKTKRSQLYWVTVLLAVISSLIAVLLITLGLGMSALSVMKNSSISITDFITFGLNLYPSVLFFSAIACLTLGFAPQKGKLVYIYLAFSFLMSYFTGLLDIPKILLNTVPQSWLAKLPIEPFDLKAFLLLTLVSLVLMLIGYLGYRKRDLIETD